MCIGCGGSCKRPRFVSEPAAVPMSVVGTAAGVDVLPDHLIRVSGGMITYESIYAGLGPNGEPAALVIPGTYGAHATRAGRR